MWVAIRTQNPNPNWQFITLLSQRCSFVQVFANDSIRMFLFVLFVFFGFQSYLPIVFFRDARLGTILVSHVTNYADYKRYTDIRRYFTKIYLTRVD